MFSKKVLALLIPALFAGSVLAAEESTTPTSTATGQVVFSGEVTAVSCKLEIPTSVALQNVGQATAADTPDYVGAYSNFVIALQNCSFQTAGTVTGTLKLSDAGYGTNESEPTESSFPTLKNVAEGHAAQGVGVQVRYLGKSANPTSPEILNFDAGKQITKVENFVEKDGAYKFFLEAAIRRLGSQAVYAGAVQSKMNVEVSYK